jgi:hypothetical protein
MVERQSQPDRPSAPESFTGRVFVGRQQEMNVLKTALEEARSGRGRRWR